MAQNLPYHWKRYQSAYFEYYGIKPKSNPFESISIPQEYNSDIVKLKLLYNETSQQYLYSQYTPKKIQTLKLVSDNSIDYHLKYTNRSSLELLLSKKGDCEDILIIKDGYLTDTSFSNIVFFDGEKWFTPRSPLLKGTMRAKLLEQNLIFERNIEVTDLNKFIKLKLINAMRDLENSNELLIKDIV